MRLGNLTIRSPSAMRALALTVGIEEVSNRVKNSLKYSSHTLELQITNYITASYIVLCIHVYYTIQFTHLTIMYFDSANMEAVCSSVEGYC